MPFIKAKVRCPISPKQEPELEAGMGRVIITIFTDPMMGISYESEPIMDRLQIEYGARIEFRNVMGLLVRDVSDFIWTKIICCQNERKMYFFQILPE